ncbi:uncharacterized protein LOC135090079 isoform X1 [Scylla paramamosain]|uniref:uncharacterized protein LOC135090079 isoform X1 n=1 Tax=Scylla paramamosain TaxID=85552 RepID=UPI0030827158
MAAPVKQKKKKDKKKEKTQVHKKRTRVESVCEDQATNDDTSPAAADSTSVQNAPTNSNNNSSGSNNNDKHKSSQKPLLPIDPESLEKAQVTILKPGLEAEEVSPTKSTKRNRKKKVKKTVNQQNLLGDPLESDSCVQSEYIARLRMLRQQRDALEAGESPNPMKPIIISCDTQKPVILLDPDNPFYLPQHLRDNPEELERVLQEKLTTSSPPGLQQETINTLLDFMYDWLKSEGPMRTNDPRLAEQVAENFPQEARDYVIQCGGITGLLMQSLKFAMIDNIICVHDDVMKAQEMMCQEVMDKMMQSKYLVRYSDGQKAKRFTHLLDDNKSTCSTTSSSSQPAGSVAESTISRDSAGTVTRWHTNHTRNDDPNNNDNDSESTVSLAPLSKAVVDQFHKFAVCALNPTAPEFEPLVSNDEGKSEDDDDDDDDDDEDEDELKRQYKRKLFDNDENTRQWSKGDCEYIENWAAQAGEKVPIMPTDEDEIEVVQDEEQEEDEEEEEDEEAEEREVVVGEGEEERTKSLQDEEDLEGTEQYISQLLEEKEKLIGDLQNEQQQNQVLSDKLYQVKSQYKSEVMKLKQQLEELKDQNRELTTEKNAIVLQREADTKKFKADLSRMNEEMKATGSRLQSSELKGERFLDQNNELQAKLAEEMELNTQLKEELEKMKNLQESLTSCSRRAREAEVKYLCTKKDLVDASMTSTISRLTEEATAMKQLLPGTTEDSVLDRTTLTRTIVLWDEAIKKLLEHQRIFKDEATRLLGMIHQGRPLSALPAGDLPIPPIPELNVAPILSRFQNNHHRPSPPTFGVSEVLSMDMPRHSSPGPQGPPHRSKATPPPPIADPSSQVSIMPISLPIIPHGALSGHPLFVHNGGLPPNHASAYASGAIPKSGTSAPPGIQHPKAAEMPCLTQQTESPNQLFVGQLPWEYTEADIKNLFSRFGEVVSVNVFDKGCNADGRPVPKYGFITFRNADDCFKALSARPIYVRNHMLNVQAKEAKKPTKPASVPAPGGGGGVVGGGAGVGGAVGGGGLTGIINEPDATNGTKSSAYGLTDITVNANVEANKSTVLHHHTLPTSPTLHHHQPPPPTTQSVTKPKFQAVIRLREGLAECPSGTTHAKLLPSNNTVGGIVAPPPKLVRPQPKTVPNASKLGGQAGTSKEENVMPSSSSYTRLIEICKQRFGKEFSSPDICIALREVRAQNNNSLSGLTTEKIVERVRQQLRSRRPSAGAATVAPWAGLTQGPGVKTEPEWQGPSKEEVVKEEQCSICLEPLNTSPNQSLACLHTFHALCINDWIKIQSNCPNCRKFALMPDEYPTLSHS